MLRTHGKRSAPPRLVLVDGFAGSGKSTTAQQVWLAHTAAHRRAIWYHEHEADHPIFQYDAVAELLQWTPARLEQHLLARWDAFARADDGRTVRIVEGSFFQIPVGLMLAMNVPPARILALLVRLEALLAPAQPVLIHLFRPDLAAAFRTIGRERSQRWIDDVTTVLSQSPYGRQHGVRDLRGLIGYYRRQRAVIEGALSTLALPRLELDVTAGRWPRYQARISAFLGMRPPATNARGLPVLLRHAGRYRGTKTGTHAIVTTDGRALYLQPPLWTAQPLIHVADGHYCVQGLPIDVRFSYDSRRRARRFEYESRMMNETVTDTSWVRV